MARAVAENIISKALADKIKEYMSFRHVVSHGYAFNLKPERLQDLTANILCLFEEFKEG